MSKTTKGWLIAAAALVIAGVTLLGGTFAAASFDFGEFGTVRYVSQTIRVQEDFQNIDIDVDTADVKLIPTDDKTCRIDCSLPEKAAPVVEVKDHTLIIRQSYRFGFFDFSFRSPTVTVYLPQLSYTALKIHTTTGDTFVHKDFTFAKAAFTASTGDIDAYADVTDTLTAEVTTGDIHLSDLSAGDITLSSTTGDISLNSVLASGDLRIDCSTGDVRFDHSDAANISVTTSTGDITGSLNAAKTFFADSNTGDVSVPRTTSGGKCELSSSTGDIIITIP